METFLLLLLGLGLVLAGASGSILEIMKEEFAKEEMQYAGAKSGPLEQTVEVFLNLTLSEQNTSMPKEILPSLLLTFRRSPFSIPERHIPGNNQDCCNVTVWRKLLEVNRSCRLGDNFSPGSMEVTHRSHRTPGCECGQSLINSWESPDVKNPLCQLSPGKQAPRCHDHRVTSLKKMFTVLTGHSLMSWLVSGSKL